MHLSVPVLALLDSQGQEVSRTAVTGAVRLTRLLAAEEEQSSRAVRIWSLTFAGWRCCLRAYRWCCRGRSRGCLQTAYSSTYSRRCKTLESARTAAAGAAAAVVAQTSRSRLSADDHDCVVPRSFQHRQKRSCVPVGGCVTAAGVLSVAGVFVAPSVAASQRKAGRHLRQHF